MSSTISAAALDEWLSTGTRQALLDVRERGEYALAHIPTACPLPRGLIEVNLECLVPWRDTPLVLYCDDGHRSALAAATCRSLGYGDVRVLEGGLSAWTATDNEPEYGVNVFGKTLGERLVSTGQVAQVEVDELADMSPDEVIVLDSRTAPEYRKGHIPGAINMPSGEMPAALLSLPAETRAETTVVVHCAGRTRSILGANLVAEMGFRRAFALRNGTMAWRLSGRRLETDEKRWRHSVDNDGHAAAVAFARTFVEPTSATPIETADLRHRLTLRRPPYLVDVRLDEAFRTDSIAGARHCAVGQLANAADEMLAVRAAEIVCYSTRDVRAQIGAALLSRIGYPRVRWLEGGLRAWKDIGGPTSSTGGSQRVPPYADVRSTVRSISPRALCDDSTLRVLDVRRSSEYAVAHIPGSIWIPRGDLERRAPQALHADEQVVVVSDRGVRAALSVKTLADRGYDSVRVLDGGLAAWAKENRTLEQGLSGADVSLREAKEDAELVAQRPALLERDTEDMLRYLDWEERLGEQFADQSP